MWGSVRGWALGEEAVAKQPEMGNTAEAASPGGLVLSSRCHGGTSPLVLIRSQGSQGHDGKTRSGVAFRTGDFSTIFLVCLLWLPVCDCDVQGVKEYSALPSPFFCQSAHPDRPVSVQLTSTLYLLIRTIY